jgi:beta-phosphoglucomutase-like phosphatase (HAD superfamily)
MMPGPIFFAANKPAKVNPVTMPGSSFPELDAALAPVRHLLLDFDGVICRLYDPASRAEAAESLKTLLSAPLSGFTGPVPQAGDPAAVLYLSGAKGTLGDVAEGELADREFAAAATARSIGFAPDLIASASESGRTVTVVSTCAARAVNAYLHRTGLAALTGLTTARLPGKPGTAAPADLLARCTRQLKAHPGTCAIVSASYDFLDAVSATGIPAICYLAKPGRPDSPADRPLVTVSSLDELVLWLRARPLSDNFT